jgi:hypothetical protein
MEKHELHNLIGKNISELSDDVINQLGNAELNCCDECGIIDLTWELHWLEFETQFLTLEDYLIVSKDSKYVALCYQCFYKALEKLNRGGNEHTIKP